MLGRAVLVAAWLAAWLPAATLPAGTELQVRLKSTVASNSSKPKDAVEAVLVSPVVIDGAIAIPAGAILRGAVAESQAYTAPDKRAALDVEFSRLVDGAGKETPVQARPSAVDNARETIEKGRIVGILASETIAARIDQGLAKLEQKSPGFGGLLQSVKQAFLKEPEPDIVYGPGIDMTLELSKPVEVNPANWQAPRALAAIEPQADLYKMVNAHPFQTQAGKPPKPSDLTTLMFLGSAQQLDEAFRAAGWSAAAKLDTASGIETFRAIAEMRGYKEAPVSLLTLDGQAPDLVFQKQNNTFAKRHHLRIWKRPGTFQGREIWVCAATQDIGIEFSPENRTFIHKIDPQIDRERAKVVNDLIFGGRVTGLALVERPAAPQHSQNATGDKLETDGRMAVVLLQ